MIIIISTIDEKNDEFPEVLEKCDFWSKTSFSWILKKFYKMKAILSERKKCVDLTEVLEKIKFCRIIQLI